MRELALFAGIGGGILGGRLLGWRTVCAVEINQFCREVLAQRQEDRILDPFPIWDDIKTFKGEEWAGCVDVVSAGFPCQPWSMAGKRRKEADERNLWPDTIRVIREVGPEWALLENVPGLLRTSYFGQILGDLAEAGFNAEWEVVPASSFGTPHKRERLWIVAYSQGKQRRWQASQESSRSNRQRRFVSGEWNDARSLFGEDHMDFVSPKTAKRKSQSGLRLVADGIPDQVEQLRAIGNSQVPIVAAMAFQVLSARILNDQR